MDKYPENFEKLIEIFKSFPGIGRRTAERMAFAILKWPTEKVIESGKTIASIHENIGSCEVCGNLCENGSLCAICSDTHRDRSVICVVEDVPQIHSIEKSKSYKGLYHVLHGKIIPLDDKSIGTEALNKLKKRLESGEIKELVMALSMDIEGQATAIYLSDIFKHNGITITRIARGIPAGSDISFADTATISAAMNGRTHFK